MIADGHRAGPQSLHHLLGWVMGPLSHRSFVPRLVSDGSVLLLGGIGFALAQRPLRSPAP